MKTGLAWSFKTIRSLQGSSSCISGSLDAMMTRPSKGKKHTFCRACHAFCVVASTKLLDISEFRNLKCYWARYQNSTWNKRQYVDSHPRFVLIIATSFASFQTSHKIKSQLSLKKRKHTWSGNCQKKHWCHGWNESVNVNLKFQFKKKWWKAVFDVWTNETYSLNGDESYGRSGETSPP